MVTSNKKYYLYAIFFSLFISNYCTAQNSSRLKGVIKSNGIGNINLLNDISTASLEVFRNSNNGNLTFAVDVNEAANGTEKARSQAITLKTVELTVTRSSSTTVYSDFFSATKTLVAEGQSSIRNEYYTLLGETGSNRITAGNTIQNEYDSTFSIRVEDNLDDAIGVQLYIELLETNASLGDPEQFYDFSNGHEDLAIVNGIDADFINDYAAGMSDAPTVFLTDPLDTPGADITSWSYLPTTSSFYIVAYEDKFPKLGDYDFNDLTVAYQLGIGVSNENNITKIIGIAYLLTRGASYDHDWRLRFPLQNSPSGVINVNMSYQSENNDILSTQSTFNGSPIAQVFSHTKDIFKDPDHQFVNTLSAQHLISGPKSEFEIIFDTPIPYQDFSYNENDPYLYVHQTQYEIHLLGHSATNNSNNITDGLNEFRDSNGYPFAMLIPDNWFPPIENIDLIHAYPQFSNFVLSAGKSNQNWHANPVLGLTKNTTKLNWKW